MLQRVPELESFAEGASEFESAVLLGMGGSSLAPEVLRRWSGTSTVHVLDTTHPEAVRRLTASLDLDRTLFLVASKSGTTMETRCHLDHFWGLTGKRGASFVAITDPGSELEALAGERQFRAVFHGEPTIGGRYSALSAFGMVPAGLMGDGRRGDPRERDTHGRAVPAGREPRRGARPPARLEVAGGPRQDRLREPARVRPLARAAPRRVHREAGEGPRPGAGRVRGRSRPRAGGAAARRRRAGRRVLPLGVRDRRRRHGARDQPLRPAERPGGEGPHPRGPFRT